MQGCDDAVIEGPCGIELFEPCSVFVRQRDALIFKVQHLCLVIHRGERAFRQHLLYALFRDGVIALQRLINRIFPIDKLRVGENLAIFVLRHIGIEMGDLLSVIGSDLVALVAHCFAQLVAEFLCIDELHLPSAFRALILGQHPHIGLYAGVVEKICRQSDDRLD